MKRRIVGFMIYSQVSRSDVFKEITMERPLDEKTGTWLHEQTAHVKIEKRQDCNR